MKKTSGDLTQGPVFKTLFRYSVPIIAINVVLSLFHAADIATLSFLAGDKAVAAVGACGTIITLLISFFTAFATGAEVLVAKRTGAQDGDGVKRATGTALVIGFLSGILLMAVAVSFAKKLLILTNCQQKVLAMATTYMRIYFLGMPVIMLTSFASAILRASGDSLRPMIYTFISGGVNILFNLLFILILPSPVAGVAVATVLSNLLALVMILLAMLKPKCICKIEAKNLRIGKTEFNETLRVAVPTCLCSIFFYAANVILSACVNDLSTEAMTANAISGHFDGLIYTVGCAIAVAVSAMVGQNYGAGRLDRIQATIKTGVVYATFASLLLGAVMVLISPPLLKIMSNDENVVSIAKDKVTLLCFTYFVTSIMEVFAFSLRSLRREKSTMVVGAVCGLGVRCLWAWFIWPFNPTLPMLFSSYAISAFFAIIIYLFVYKKAVKSLRQEFTPNMQND
ncbi:MAG: MATE family efflux transporter [Oscillospiraceae bacterium]|nr:MATE family efflux transporter [Oscillospiraceae bacterium]